MEFDLNQIGDFLSQALQHEVTKWTIGFCIAAWFHSGRVKREIKEQFKGLTAVIDNVGQALRLDLQTHSARIGKVESDVATLNSEVKLIKGDK